MKILLLTPNWTTRSRIKLMNMSGPNRIPQLHLTNKWAKANTSLTYDNQLLCIIFLPSFVVLPKWLSMSHTKKHVKKFK